MPAALIAAFFFCSRDWTKYSKHEPNLGIIPLFYPARLVLSKVTTNFPNARVSPVTLSLTPMSTLKIMRRARMTRSSRLVRHFLIPFGLRQSKPRISLINRCFWEPWFMHSDKNARCYRCVATSCMPIWLYRLRKRRIVWHFSFA